MTATFQKLVDANIELLPVPEITSHFVFHRDGFAALVERVRDNFGRIGAAGLLTEQGLAVLQWRGSDAFFVLKDLEQPASTVEIDRLRAFQRDLESALA
jgi:hypothetical protein